MTPATLALGLLAWTALGLLVAQLNRNGPDTPPRSPAMPPRTDPGNCYLPELAHAAHQAQLALRAAENTLHLAAMGQIPRVHAAREYHRALATARACLEEIDRQAAAWITPPPTYPAPVPIEDDYQLTQRTERVSQLEA